MPGKAQDLVRQIDRGALPAHIAIIMDGNGRWARKRGLPRVAGHRAGINAVRQVVEGSAELGISVLTLYAFSLDNWKRPHIEVTTLMQLLKEYLYTACQPDPDLLIRTSGELRISNFLLWQIAYAEIWVTETLWPDFEKQHLYQAIIAFQKRERRYGGLEPQLVPTLALGDRKM